jgi:diketogulonate reductase-like aldo/keto reductase
VECDEQFNNFAILGWLLVEKRSFGWTREHISVIGMGTYYDTMETSPDTFPGKTMPGSKTVVEGLKRGLELGLNFIDTAEVYLTEPIVAEAMQNFKRDDFFIATKVWPSRAGYEDLLRAADRSLERLKTKYIDLYQIHWPSRRVPIRETMRGMERLVNEGKIRYIGVSNFTVTQVQESVDSLSKQELISDQVEYNLLVRDIEADLLPYSERLGLAVIAYRPLSNGALANPPRKVREAMDSISKRHGGKTYSQISLNWIKEKSPALFPIPRISSRERAEEDAGGAGWSLTPEEMKLLETAARA